MPKAGQVFSKEAVEKMNISKQKKLLSKYKWELIEPYLDVDINIGSRNRKKKFITLREFKQLILDGNSLKDMYKVTSKHLVMFYSKFSQGEISLSSEKFNEEYKNGMSLVDIAEKHKISKDSITFLRQLYGVKNTGPTYIHRKQTEVPLTLRQKAIMYGSMMGDAKKMSPSSVAFVHGKPQKDYLLWKYNEFKNVVSENSLKSLSSIDPNSESENTQYRFYTKANTDAEACVSCFYQSGEKEISPEVLKNLLPLSIAIWYCDDGKTDFGHRSIIKSNYNIIPTCVFCTESFSKESCENIQKWFLDEHKFCTELVERPLSNKMGYRVKICSEDAYRFLDFIKPHVPSMFYYKGYLDVREERSKIKVGGKIYACPLGADFSVLSLEDQDTYIDSFVTDYQEKGLLYFVGKPDDWEKHMMSVINHNPDNIIKDDYISFNNLGNKFLMSHFPNYWEAKAKGNLSPKQVFENREYLSDIIRKIIVSGYFPTEKKIAKALKRYRGNKSLSGFMPCVAKAIYHKYCDENAKVFDFCAGYGGRLFGAMSCEKVLSYSGIEVNFNTYTGLNELYRTLRLHADIKKEMNVFNQDSILGMEQFSDKAFDFCFTSPPYFDAEVYEENNSQSFNKYNKYSDWFNLYLISAVKEARRISKKVAINIANTGGYEIANDFRRWLSAENIDFIEDRLREPQYGGGGRFEPLFVF
tara:strand:- start:4390 stop:6480 length:2091 start_codon:yes stop_codon:yes gene_type:complete